MCRSKPQGGRRCNGVAHRPEYRSASRKVLRHGGTPQEAREAGLAAVEARETRELDALLDATAAQAQEEYEAHHRLILSLPEELQPVGRALLGGAHLVEYGFHLRPEAVCTPEQLDVLGRRLGLAPCPRPDAAAGDLEGITVGNPMPDPLPDEVVDFLSQEDLATYRADRRHESQRIWNAITGVLATFDGPDTPASVEARRRFGQALRFWFFGLFDPLMSKPRINPAITD